MSLQEALSHIFDPDTARIFRIFVIEPKPVMEWLSRRYDARDFAHYEAAKHEGFQFDAPHQELTGSQIEQVLALGGLKITSLLAHHGGCCDDEAYTALRVLLKVDRSQWPEITC